MRKLFKGIIVSAMVVAMLIPSFSFADDGPFIKDLSKLRAKPYEWQFYDENGKAIDKRVILADVKMKALSARHVETHGVKMPDGKEFVKDYFNDLDNKIKDEKIRIGNHELFENTICAIKNQDVKYTDKEVFKKVYLKELGLEDKVEFTDGWYSKEILYICALPGSEIEVTNLYTGGKIRDGSFKLKVNEDCSLSPVDNTTQVDGDVVKMFLGKKPADTDKPNADKLADKPSVDKPSVDNNKPVDKVDVNKPAVSNTDNALDVSDANAESNRPTIAKNSNVPKTSDGSNIILYSVLLLSAITATGIILKRRFRTE